MSKTKIIATKDGVTKEFGYIQWQMLADKSGNHDGWTQIDADGSMVGKNERFIPNEVRSNQKKTDSPASPAINELPAEEKDALAALSETVNGKTEATVVKKKRSGRKKKEVETANQTETK